MRLLQVLGPGCSNCENLSQNVCKAARDLGLEFRFEKVKEMNAIARFGVIITPALVVDGEVKSSGRVLSVEEVKKLLL